MRRNTFYRCIKEKKKVIAVRTSGFVDGDIGLHKNQDLWCATHIPTGMRLTPVTSEHKTAKAALTEAKRLIAEKSDFPALIQSVMDSDNYKAFSKSIYAQSVTEVF